MDTGSAGTPADEIISGLQAQHDFARFLATGVQPDRQAIGDAERLCKDEHKLTDSSLRHVALFLHAKRSHNKSEPVEGR